MEWNGSSRTGEDRDMLCLDCSASVESSTTLFLFACVCVCVSGGGTGVSLHLPGNNDESSTSAAFA
jgi:hypothetical protein